MKIIIGLGNPGERYQKTRHNAGEFYLSKFIKLSRLNLDSHLKSADYVWSKIGKEKVILVFPKEFMNNSGPSAKKLLADLKIKFKPQDILVLHDDLDIAFGKIKLSFAKSSAGHKGVESIIKTIKNDKFWRLRIGIASKKKPEHKKIVDFLLKKFTPAEEQILNTNFKKIAEGTEEWLTNTEKASVIINSR